MEKTPGLRMALYRTAYGWLTAKMPRKNVTSYRIKLIIGYYIISWLFPVLNRFIGWITKFFPFSLMWQESLLHASNIKAQNLMRGMEAETLSAGIPVYINTGYRERNLSVFIGKFERGGINKQKAVAKMQELFQKKFGTVYVQEEKTGFRVLVDSKMV